MCKARCVPLGRLATYRQIALKAGTWLLRRQHHMWDESPQRLLGRPGYESLDRAECSGAKPGKPVHGWQWAHQMKQPGTEFVVWHDAFMHRNPSKLRLLIVMIGLLTASCESGSDEKQKPTGTPTDPVMECEKHGQVCRIDSSRLGVCITPTEEKRQAICEGRFPCLQCMPQH